ncbi:TFIIB-type zinc finger domain-containing protein [Lactiplantibacillus paraxiangfangensis]|uniref:TFIIB-type zinc finger domain-containing protein n=1 Tax=Lactiplantibacillus paraxiangfangensis TaxID=3076224 RepID=UPI0030C74F4E
MEEYKCNKCGASDFAKVSGQLVCNYCGSVYMTKNTEQDSSEADISLNSDIAMLLKKIQNDPNNAQLYANLILDIDPTNQEVFNYFD